MTAGTQQPVVPTILHLDMDAFFAAIEVLDRPELAGQPVIVGAPPDRRGVVSTCSYEARKFGVRSAMPSRTAFKLCPHGIFVPPRMERYAEVSRQLLGILDEFTPDIEPVSIDEAFLDVRSVIHFWADPLALAQAIKHRIRTRLCLTASIGIAINKFLAKVASDLRKPDGITVVPVAPEAIRSFLAPLPISRIWGVGKVTEKQLVELGLTTIGHIQALTEAQLQPILGESMAAHVHALAYGSDTRKLELHWEEKSLSNETTFEQDCLDPTQIRQTLIELAEEVGRRLRASGKAARTGHIKVRFADFGTISRQTTFPTPVSSDRDIMQMALELYGKLKNRRAIRLLGVGVTHLVRADASAPSEQPLLFPDLEDTRRRKRNHALDQAVDRVRKTFGADALRRGEWEPIGPKTPKGTRPRPP